MTLPLSSIRRYSGISSSRPLLGVPYPVSRYQTTRSKSSVQLKRARCNYISYAAEVVRKHRVLAFDYSDQEIQHASAERLVSFETVVFSSSPQLRISCVSRVHFSIYEKYSKSQYSTIS